MCGNDAYIGHKISAGMHDDYSQVHRDVCVIQPCITTLTIKQQF